MQHSTADGKSQILIFAFAHVHMNAYSPCPPSPFHSPPAIARQALHLPVTGRRRVECLGDDVPHVIKEGSVPLLELGLTPVQLGDDGLVEELWEGEEAREGRREGDRESRQLDGWMLKERRISRNACILSFTP